MNENINELNAEYNVIKDMAEKLSPEEFHKWLLNRRSEMTSGKTVK